MENNCFMLGQLNSLSSFRLDSDARNMLECAVALQEESLKHLDRDLESQHWSHSQENVGNIQFRLAEFESGKKGRHLHGAAGEACKAVP